MHACRSTLEDPTLFDERSRRIEKNLLGLEDLESAHAETDALCLACHSQPPAPVPAAVGPVLTPTGVGCESCHGPARDWLDEHYSEAWKSKGFGAEEKRARGMVLMDTAVSLTGVCVRCHVGTADQEVNHDLIAAGHPRLNFEAVAFLHDMPRHWDEADVVRPPGPVTTAENWAIGQVVTAQAAAALLQARATAARAPWPEFTEYGCFACHHDLHNQGLKFRRADLELPPGALPWGSWAFPLVSALAAGPGGADGLPEDLGKVAQLMGAPVPDRSASGVRAAGIARSLDAWLGRLQSDRFDLQRFRTLLTSLHEDDAAIERLTAHWDAAAQLYLALAALRDCYDDDPALRGNLDELQKALDDLGGLLEFPRLLDGTPLDSPGTKYQRDSVRAAVDAVFQALPPP